jgi:hypothetical protein
MSRKRRPKSRFQAIPLKPELEISSIQEVEKSGTTAPESATVPEPVEFLKRGTSDITLEDDEDDYKIPVINQFQKRKSIYFSVTESEINMYAQLGVISTLLLTLFGAFIGIAAGCFLALVQENIPAEAQTLLQSTGWVTMIVSIIFFGFALWFIYLQFKNKKSWESFE